VKRVAKRAIAADMTADTYNVPRSEPALVPGSEDPAAAAHPGKSRSGSSAVDTVAVIPLDAREQQSLLTELLRAPEPPLARPKVVAPAPKVASPWNARLRRAGKALLALLVAAALGWQPVLRLFETASAEAVINARLITLRSPIDGQIAASGSPIVVGSRLQPDQPFASVLDARADRSRLSDLTRSVQDLQGQLIALGQKQARLRALRDALTAQIEAFRDGRILQLESRVDELAAEISSAEAQLMDANANLERATKLSLSGAQSIANQEHAQRDAKIAQARLDALRSRREGIGVELKSARAGLFIGDSYNDTPQSAQRAHEISVQIADVEAQTAEVEGRLKNAIRERGDEERRFGVLSFANISSPRYGRVWEVLTAPGEEVRRNQDLLRVLDCEGAIVTAAVSESVYNSLRMGDPAQFKLRGDNRVHAGRVNGLYGLAAVPANFAIQQTALSREPYHVSIEIPDLKSVSDCDVGRTGKVTFGAPSASTQ
jgi:multidrug resistance efflux pump